MVEATHGGGASEESVADGFGLYRSRPINSQMRRRFPHTLYYAAHFNEESHRLVFAFLGPDGQKEAPDILVGLDAQTQWNRFVDVMVRDPLISGLRVERIGTHATLDECVMAARSDATPTGEGARRRTPSPREEALLVSESV